MLDLNNAALQISHLDKDIIAQAQDIVKREGGYVNDPDDSGGATNHGVSLAHARAQGKAFDIDHDGDVDADDIRLVTPEMATVDFLMCFFIDPQLNKLPKAIQFCAFDHSVNGGPSAAIRLVQRAVNSLNLQGMRLVEDGRFGPNTMLTTMRADDAVGDNALLNALVETRLQEYRNIVARKPETGKFLKGWTARAELFRPKVK